MAQRQFSKTQFYWALPFSSNKFCILFFFWPGNDIRFDGAYCVDVCIAAIANATYMNGHVEVELVESVC